MTQKIGIKLLISLVTSGFLLSLLIFEGTKATITLIADGKKEVIRTHAKTVEDLLVFRDFDYKKQDKVSPALDTKIKNGMTVTWKPSKKVFLVLNGEKKPIWTTNKTVDEIIRSRNLAIDEHDKVLPGGKTEVENNMIIKVIDSVPVTLNVGGKEKKVWTTSTTVADLLKQQDIKLRKLDKVQPNLQQKIKEEMAVHVIRVEKVTDVVEEPVEFAVVTRSDENLKAGNKKVLKQGKPGLIEKHYEVVLENGKEVSRKLVKEVKVRDSKDKVVAVGTKQIDYKVSRSNNDSVAKEMYMKATAYTAYCNGCSGVTSTGINLRKNPHMKVIAVDPDVIPLGSKVWVEGYGYAIAGDVGSAIQGNKIDVFFSDKEKAHSFGRKTVRVKILE